jgi:DNA-directed RNA polymerase subunit RPC12/RpoP
MAFSCPSCGGKTGVTNTEPTKIRIVRRRVCTRCGSRFTTEERVYDRNMPRRLDAAIAFLIEMEPTLTELGHWRRRVSAFLDKPANPKEPHE